MAKSGLSRGLHPLIVVLVLAGVSSVVGVVACSGDDDDAKALCVQGCDKLVSCNPQLQGFVGSCKTRCEQPAEGASNQRCANEAAIVSKYKECLSTACPQFEGCLGAIPACQGNSTSGTGGTTGAGGTQGMGGTTGTGGVPGTGGMSGSTDCSVCTKADACCTAFAALSNAGTGACTLEQACATSGGNASTVVETCTLLITNIAQAAPDLAACK